MDLISIIKKQREKKGLSRTQLAHAAGLSPAAISLIESGKKSPTLTTLEKISSALEIPLPILTFLALETEDVQPEKRAAFQQVRKPVLAMIEEFFTRDVE